MKDAMPEPTALYAYEAAKDGSTRSISLSEFDNPLTDSIAYRWAHLDLAQQGVLEWISKISDSVVADALTLDDTRPRCDAHGDGALVNLRGVNLNPASDPEDMVSVRLWATPRLIVSVRLRRLSALATLREEIEAGQGPRSVGGFLVALVDGLTERMDPIVGDLSESLDGLEEKSIEAPDQLRDELADVRRAAVILRRYIAPQREALQRLLADGVGLLAKPDKVSLRETIDRVTRIVEELDAMRERGAVLHDQLTDRRAEEMNRNMMILSVVAAIFLPLGFLTGLLGVNVGGIPGADNGFAFIIVCIVMVLIAAGLVLLFKKMKWL